MKKILSLILAMLMIALTATACSKPKDEDSDETEPEETVEEKSPSEAYSEVKKFFDGLTEVVISGTITENKTVGTESEDTTYKTVANAKGIGTDGFKLSMDMNGIKAVYIDGYSYINEPGGIKVKMQLMDGELSRIFNVESFVNYDFEDYASATVAREGENTVLTLKGISKEQFAENHLGVTKDDFDTDEKYNEYVSTLEEDAKHYTETFTLDKNGTVTAFTMEYSYPDGENTVVSYKEENTVSTEAEDVAVPEDADEYLEF